MQLQYFSQYIYYDCIKVKSKLMAQGDTNLFLINDTKDNLQTTHLLS